MLGFVCFYVIFSFDRIKSSMKFLIVDDHQLFLDGMRLLLAKLAAEVKIIEANRGDEALRILESCTDFDLIVLDMNMPGLDGTSLVLSLRERKLWIPVVIVSAEDDPRQIKRVLDAGAMGYLSKAESGPEMLAALRTVLDGELFLSPALENRINRLGSSGSRRVADTDSARKLGITRRQLHVLQRLEEGLSNQQIALTLNLTENTVKSHLSALFQILGVNNRTECVRLSQERGLLTHESRSAKDD